MTWESWGKFEKKSNCHPRWLAPEFQHIAAVYLHNLLKFCLAWMQKVELGNPAFLFGHCKKKHPNMPQGKLTIWKKRHTSHVQYGFDFKAFYDHIIYLLRSPFDFWLQSYNCLGELPLQISWNVPMNHFTADYRSKKDPESPVSYFINCQKPKMMAPFWVVTPSLPAHVVAFKPSHNSPISSFSCSNSSRMSAVIISSSVLPPSWGQQLSKRRLVDTEPKLSHLKTPWKIVSEGVN